MKKNNNEIKSLIKSFKNAFNGIFYTIKSERNMRIHISAAIFALIFSGIMQISKFEFAIILLAITLVIFAEMVNTAIEYVVEMVIQSYNKLAKITKDIAAGAVFFCAIFAFTIGIVIFVKYERLMIAFDFFKNNLIIFIACILLLIIAFIFIFLPFNKIKRRKK